MGVAPNNWTLHLENGPGFLEFSSVHVNEMK